MTRPYAENACAVNARFKWGRRCEDAYLLRRRTRQRFQNGTFAHGEKGVAPVGVIMNAAVAGIRDFQHDHVGTGQLRCQTAGGLPRTRGL